MPLREKLEEPAAPAILFEMVPPPAGKPGAMEVALADLEQVRSLADAINLPEIRNETRDSARTVRFVERLEPRRLGQRIIRELGLDVVVNRCVVYEPEQDRWFRDTYEQFGIDHLILVGGESSQVAYPGPSVHEACEQARATGLPLCLGGISIPSRLGEPERIRRKREAGLTFFTTQVLFDSNDIVWLVQKLNGLEARLFLSFAPVSHPRDLEFLRWLGADIPPDLDRFLLQDPSGSGEGIFDQDACLERSLSLAQRILMDVFDNLPPDPPALGLNIEHINRRNFRPAVRMLERLGDLYSSLVAARARA
jgi:5,10-methylenetetrahydrofolate reductase